MTENTVEIQKRLKVCTSVFLILLVLTGLNVGVFYLFRPAGSHAALIALLIAGIQASLAGAYMMHLNSEKRLVYRVLFFTGVFFLALMLLTLLALRDGIKF